MVASFAAAVAEGRVDVAALCRRAVVEEQKTQRLDTLRLALACQQTSDWAAARMAAGEVPATSEAVLEANIRRRVAGLFKDCQAMPDAEVRRAFAALPTLASFPPPPGHELTAAESLLESHFGRAMEFPASGVPTLRASLGRGF